jgi:GH24 family phage-related lysozyme (muramidase)
MALSTLAGQVRSQFKDEAGGRVNSAIGIYIAIVKNNKDENHMGRLQVWVPEMKGDPEDSANWLWVSYCSPFAGATNPEQLGGNVKEGNSTQLAYGFWAVPPDINNEVIVAFPSGDTAKGVWLGGLFQQANTFTIPGIPRGKVYGQNDQNAEAPSAEKNKRDADNDAALRPRHPTLADALESQGLNKDYIRGVTDSGAHRDSPSQVYGMLTPGQNQFVMDDGGPGKGIRLRTANGAQILINDQFGMIYLINKSGSAWLELSADGHIDAYAESGINFHTNGDFNMRAGGNVNIEAGGGFNVASGADIRMSAGGTGNIQSAGNLKLSGAETHINGESPEAPKSHGLAVNSSIRNSIASRVPEHEPWRGHINVQPGAVDASGSPVADPNTSTEPVDTDDIPPSENVDNITCIPLADLHISKPGIDFILGMERYRPIEYWDFRSNSIGFGHLQDGKSYDKASDFSGGMTYDEAYNKFVQDIQAFEKSVKSSWRSTKCMTQPQFDAIISGSYNMGAGGFSGISFQGKKITELAGAGNWEAVANGISACTAENGRRVKEATVMKSGNYPQGLTKPALENEGRSVAKKQIEKSSAQIKGPDLGGGRYKPVMGTPTEVQKKQWDSVKTRAGW